MFLTVSYQLYQFIENTSLIALPPCQIQDIMFILKHVGGYLFVTVGSNGKNGEDGPLTPLFKAVDNAWSDLFLTNKITTVSIAIL